MKSVSNAASAAASGKTSDDDGLEGKKGKKDSKKKVVQEDDEDWGEVDVSEEAIKARRLEMEKGFSKAVQDMICSEVDYMELPESERVDLFVKFIADESKSMRQIFDEAVRLDVCDTAVHKLVELQWGAEVIKRIGPTETLFRTFTHENEDMMVHVLGSVEELVTQQHPGLLPETFKIVHLLYEHEIVEEKIILAWASQKSSKFTSNKLLWEKVKRASSKFIEWLENAESESDEEDATAGEAADGIAFSSNVDEIETNDANTQGRGTSSKYVIPTLSDKAQDEGSDEEDFDIADI